MIDRSITYNRETKDFDCFVDNRYVGSRPNYRAGDELCNEIAYDLAEQGLVDTLPVFCSTCDGEGRIPAYGTGDQAGGYAETCPDCDGMRVSLTPPFNDDPEPGPEGPGVPGDDRPLLVDVHQVISLALGRTHGSASIVGELRRIQARLESALA